MSAHGPGLGASAEAIGGVPGAAGGSGTSGAPPPAAPGGNDFRHDGTHGGYRDRNDNFRRAAWQTNNPSRQGGNSDHRMRYNPSGGEYISEEMRPTHRGRGGRNNFGEGGFGGNRPYAGNRNWQDNAGHRGGRRGGGVGNRGMQHPSALSLNRMSSTDSQSNDQRQDFSRGGAQGPSQGRGGGGLYGGDHRGGGNQSYQDPRFGSQMGKPQGGYHHNRLPNSPAEDSRRRRDPTGGNVMETANSSRNAMLHTGPPPPPPASSAGNGGAGQPPPRGGHDSPGRPVLESPAEVVLMPGSGLMPKQTSPQPQGPLLHFAPNSGNELQQPALQRSPGDWHPRAPTAKPQQQPQQGGASVGMASASQQQTQAPPHQQIVGAPVAPAVMAAPGGTGGGGAAVLVPSSPQPVAGGPPVGLSQPIMGVPAQPQGVPAGIILAPQSAAVRRIWTSVPSDELPPQYDPSHAGPDPQAQPGYVTKGLNLALRNYIQSLKEFQQQKKGATMNNAARRIGLNTGGISSTVTTSSSPSRGAPVTTGNVVATTGGPAIRSPALGSSEIQAAIPAPASPAIPQGVITTPSLVSQPLGTTSGRSAAEQHSVPTPVPPCIIPPPGVMPVPTSPPPSQRRPIANTAVAVAEAHMHQQQQQARAQQQQQPPDASPAIHARHVPYQQLPSQQPIVAQQHPMPHTTIHRGAVSSPVTTTVGGIIQESRQVPEGAVITPSGKLQYSMDFLRSLKNSPSVLNRPKILLQPAMSPQNSTLSRDIASQSSFGSRHARRTSTGKANVPPAPQRAPPPKPQVPQQQRGTNRPGLPRDVALRRHVKGLLNKMTVERFEYIADQLAKALETAEDENLLRVVVEEVYAKSVSEPNFSEMYADLVVVLRARSPWFLPTDPSQKPSDFVRLLVIACQTEFDNMEDFAKLDLPPEMVKEMSDDDIEVERQKRKTRTLGNMRFIGELFMRRVLSYKALTHILYAPVLKQNQSSSEIFTPEAHVVECLCELLTTIGFSMEQVGAETMNMLMHRLDLLKEMGGYELRIQYKIQDLLDLRGNNWKQQHVFAQKANTLSAVKQGESDNDVAGVQSDYPYKEYVRRWDEQWPIKKTQMKNAWEDYVAKCSTGPMSARSNPSGAPMLPPMMGASGALATGSDMSPATDSPPAEPGSPPMPPNAPPVV